MALFGHLSLVTERKVHPPIPTWKCRMRGDAGLCPAPAKEPFEKGSLESPKLLRKILLCVSTRCLTDGCRRQRGPIPAYRRGAGERGKCRMRNAECRIGERGIPPSLKPATHFPGQVPNGCPRVGRRSADNSAIRQTATVKRRSISRFSEMGRR